MQAQFLTFCGALLLLSGYEGQIRKSVLEESRIIGNLFQNYDKRIRPTGTNGTLEVGINCHVLDVYNVDESKHEFTVNMFLRHRWTDSRLKFARIPGMSSIVLDADHVQQLWTPDTFIRNERSAIRHNIGTSQEYTKILSDGRVLQSKRITVTASCKMNIGYFPFDRQLCGLEFASYVNIGRDYVFNWMPEIGASISEDLSLSSLNFKFAGIKTTIQTVVFPSANQTRLGLEFFFVRHATRFFQDVFFPTFVLTILAFCSLYIRPTTLKLQLTIFLMVAMILFMNFISSWIPRVSYQTALDVYVFVSAFLMFLAVGISFVETNFREERTGDLQEGFRLQGLNQGKEEEAVDYERNNDLRDPLCESTKQNAFLFRTRLGSMSKMIRANSKRFLPISYICFNLIYWMVVLIGSSWYPEGFIAVEQE